MNQYLGELPGLRKIYPLPDQEPEAEEYLSQFPPAIMSGVAREHMREVEES
ncbi:hypothetical protein [Streptomyces sp. NPDC101393]|uniref:hypothetical protein n=1 Tax=Streptomyces sp. NPDC101393 TaxID=3366141 RepID=UPI0038195D24